MQFIAAILRWVFGVVIAAAVTLGLFLVLPVMQAIGEKEDDTYTTQDVNIIETEAPPDIPEPEPPEPEEEEEVPEPELNEEPLVADINQLDNLLDGFGGVGIPGADTTINIDSIVGDGDDFDKDFGFGGLDQDARPIYQESPKNLSPTLRRKLQKSAATVIVLLIVDKRGKVTNATVQSSSDPAFERVALSAVKKWQFEPAQRKGKPVESRVRVPIQFPKE